MKQLAVSLLALVACSHDHPADKTTTTTPPAGPVGAIHAFKIGALDAVAVQDGAMQLPNDGKTFGLGHDPAEVTALLVKAGAPGDHFDLSIQPLLVKDGAHVVLFDTGNGGADARLGASLALAGVAPATITDIFISHAHHDHVGGLVGTDGKLAFPNATVHLSAPEWAAMQAEDKSKDIASAIAPKVAAFEPGAQVLPEVLAVDTHGHTPGHASYDISSGGEHLFYTGDTVHSAVVSIARPSWPIAFDHDQDLGAQVRAALVAKLAADHTRVYAVHFPFPGLGRVTGSGDAMVWTPE